MKLLTCPASESWALSSRNFQLRELPRMGDSEICHGFWRKTAQKADQSDRMARLKWQDLVAAAPRGGGTDRDIPALRLLMNEIRR